MLFKYDCLNSILIYRFSYLASGTSNNLGEGSLIKKLMMWALNGSKT